MAQTFLDLIKLAQDAERRGDHAGAAQLYRQVGRGIVQSRQRPSRRKVMATLSIILLAFAFVFACFAAFGVESLGRVHTFPLSVALLIGAMLFGAVLPFLR